MRSQVIEKLQNIKPLYNSYKIIVKNHWEVLNYKKVLGYKEIIGHRKILGYKRL